MSHTKLFPTLEQKIKELEKAEIPLERKEILQNLIDFIQDKKDADLPVRLNFICTHNSRRSQFSQIWAHLASKIYNIPTECFSGGTEVTAFHANAINSMARAGFKSEKTTETNPEIKMFYSEQESPLICYSKLYDSPENPSNLFAAVMTCSHADENCPVIPGADARIPLDYLDPKAFDNTPQVEEKYDERRDQIGAEMLYVFQKIK
ncbi:low molecular weight phosphatase family protein [Christiangramia aquimixticola]|uniref:arsenate-mycothiol transferase ArsC n=1 Tax=Christiangramia aquimixticola TaxID=1697558 RepID=UPI003AA8A605